MRGRLTTLTEGVILVEFEGEDGTTGVIVLGPDDPDRPEVSERAKVVEALEAWEMEREDRVPPPGVDEDEDDW